MTATMSITSRQSKKFKQLFGDAADRTLDKITVDKDVLQQVIEHGDELQDALVKAALAVVNKYANNVSAPTIVLPKASEPKPKPKQYGYPQGFVHATAEERLAKIEKEFPGLDASHVMDLASKFADLAPPREAIGIWPKIRLLCASGEKHPYNAASIVVTDKLEATHNLNNWRKGALGETRLRPHAESWALWEQWEKDTLGDYVVKLYQYGDLHLGESVNTARTKRQAVEALLGVYGNSILILTDKTPRIDNAEKTSYLDCGLDEYSPCAGGDFWYSLFFFWFDRRLRLVGCRAVGAYPRFGSSSAFAS